MELLAQEEQFTAILKEYELKCRVRAFGVCLAILSIPESCSYSLSCSSGGKGGPLHRASTVASQKLPGSDAGGHVRPHLSPLLGLQVQGGPQVTAGASFPARTSYSGCAQPCVGIA